MALPYCPSRWWFGRLLLTATIQQMHGYVESLARRDLADERKPERVGLRQPLSIADSNSTQ